MKIISRILMLAFFFSCMPAKGFTAGLLPIETQSQQFVDENKPEAALSLIEQSLKAGNESPELYNIQARAFFLLGEINESLRSLAAYEILWNIRRKQSDAVS